MIERQGVAQLFRGLYGREPRLFGAPGRVNLIGEHTDYNDGFVLPVAINRQTMIAGAVRNDRIIRAFSVEKKERVEFDLDRPGAKQRRVWQDYVEGIARALEAGGARLLGADLLIVSDVPEGAGLSSSAALEISVGFALLSLAEIKIDRVQLALAGQRAEHEYVGTKSGIMDQFIAAMGRAGHALLIDCRALTATPVPVDTSETEIVICNTGIKHALASSAYNERRSECERGVEILRKALPAIKALRDVSVEDFQKHEQLLPEPIRRRCRHVVTEDARALQAAAALESGDLPQMGQLMYASHRSLRDDYEVSCRELDVLVEIASSIEGVLGARMTGGGFGGSTVNLVARHRLEEFSEIVARRYHEATAREPAIYISEACDGANEIL
jgi:galactokinase